MLKEQGLEQWLEKNAGLTGPRLQMAVDMCQAAGIEGVADLREMLEAGDLKEVLKARALLTANAVHVRIKNALENSGDSSSKVPYTASFVNPKPQDNAKTNFSEAAPEISLA